MSRVATVKQHSVYSNVIITSHFYPTNIHNVLLTCSSKDIEEELNDGWTHIIDTEGNVEDLRELL